MANSDIKIGILGAGISGLAAAYWLSNDGYDVTVLEKNNYTGGAMISHSEKGFMADLGPNSGLETSPFIRKIVESVGLGNEMIYADSAGNKRYILKNNKLYALTPNPLKFFSSGLLSFKGKFKLLKEPFIGKSEDGYYQSISTFVKRRLGSDFLDYIINPFVSGVYAGNPDLLSVKSAFPKLYRLEEEYGGLIKGTIKGSKERKQRNENSKQNARMFSFRNGMQSFPNSIADNLIKKPVLSCEIKNINYHKKSISVSSEVNGKNHDFNFNILISAIPAYNASDLFQTVDDNLAAHLSQIYYPPVMVLFAVFRKKDIQRKLDGFGFLIPEKERKQFLGAIWSSVIFTDRCSEDLAAFTLFIGGARQSDIFKTENNLLINGVLAEFKSLMKIKENPVYQKSYFWEKAIPQYNIGYIEHDRYFEHFENTHPGIILSGNYRGGISVGDCIKNSRTVYEKTLKYAVENF